MAIEHVNITDPYIHEPKGLSNVSVANQVYLSDGAGGGSWQKSSPHGGMYFLDLGSPYTLAATTSYQKLAPTTTTTHVDGFTQSGSGRLTYDGTEDRHYFLDSTICIDHAAGANRDITIGLYKNGTIITGAEIISTTRTGEKINMTITWDGQASTGDYFELYAKISTNTTISVYAYHLHIHGVPD